jgi:hypothetical protein
MAVLFTALKLTDAAIEARAAARYMLEGNCTVTFSIAAVVCLPELPHYLRHHNRHHYLARGRSSPKNTGSRVLKADGSISQADRTLSMPHHSWVQGTLTQPPLRSSANDLRTISPILRATERQELARISAIF